MNRTSSDVLSFEYCSKLNTSLQLQLWNRPQKFRKITVISPEVLSGRYWFGYRDSENSAKCRYRTRCGENIQFNYLHIAASGSRIRSLVHICLDNIIVKCIIWPQYSRDIKIMSFCGMTHICMYIDLHFTCTGMYNSYNYILMSSKYATIDLVMLILLNLLFVLLYKLRWHLSSCQKREIILNT